ncbi:hypothetical protein [Nocardiopsis chromatogenes]|uniref:hypothetical protein n=1 Tax=Nocardiopsis chromatogenes TaxID=280239 RepID=UPI0003486AE6|nr:hypothetical protein [Nocardiopsis chromatogenes]
MGGDHLPDARTAAEEARRFEAPTGKRPGERAEPLFEAAGAWALSGGHTAVGFPF